MKLWMNILCLLCGVLNVGSPIAAMQVSDARPPKDAVQGDVADELGDNLMLVHQDKKDHFWFATWGDGLYRYDGRSVVHFTTKHGLCHNRINQILEDEKGNLYFNTSAGVNQFDGEQFTKLPVSTESEWKLSPDDLWFTSPEYSGEVFRFDGERLHALRLPKNDVGEKFLAKHPGAALNGVYSIYRDSKRNVWFGTAALGVCRYDGKSFEWLSSSDVNELHDGPANGVRSIIEDRDGCFWFNTLYRYKVDLQGPAADDQLERTGIFSRFAGIGGLDDRPNNDFHEFMSITKDNGGNLWMATYGGGVFCFDGKKLKHYPVVNGGKVVTLFSIYKDKKGVIWLGTHQNGAYRLKGESFERFEPGKR